MPVRRVSLAIIAIAGLFLASLFGVRMTFLDQERAAALERAEIGTRDLARVLEEYARRAFETADLTTQQVATRVAAAGGIGFPAATADFSDRAWLRAHVEGAERHVGEAILSRVTQEILFTYTRALRRQDGSLDGAVQVAQRLGFFQEQAVASEVGSGASLAMFDIDGRILARTGMTPAMVGGSIAGTPMLTDFAGRASGT